MRLNQIKPITKRKKRKRIGRGGKRGTYSGRGIKGQRSRAGRRFVPAIRQLFKKYPKLRGYRFGPKKRNLVIVNLKDIEAGFNEGDSISPNLLIEKGLIRKREGRVPEVKILGQGDIKKKISFEGFIFSEKAKEKIKKAGGKIK